jgi:hypothetical protein
MPQHPQKNSRVHDEGVKNTPYIEEEEMYVGILTFLGTWQVKNTTPLDKTADPQLDSKREVYQLMSVSKEGDEEAVKFFLSEDIDIEVTSMLILDRYRNHEVDQRVNKLCRCHSCSFASGIENGRDLDNITANYLQAFKPLENT